MSNDVISRSELIKELRKEYVKAAAEWIKYPERLEEVERTLEIVRGIPGISNDRIIILPEGIKPGDRAHEIYRFCGEGAWEVDVHQLRLEDIPRMGRTVFTTMEDAKNAIEDAKGEVPNGKRNYRSR